MLLLLCSSCRPCLCSLARSFSALFFRLLSVDCVPGGGPDKCQGGWPDEGLVWAGNNGGVVTEALYKYKAIGGTCKKTSEIKEYKGDIIKPKAVKVRPMTHTRRTTAASLCLCSLCRSFAHPFLASTSLSRVLSVLDRSLLG